LELLGEEIRLRPVDDSDIDDLHNWWNDPGFAGRYDSFFPKSESEVEELVKEGRFFVILSRSEDKKIGFIVYHLTRSDYLNLFEAGCRINPGERRKGYATEATRLIVDYIFETKRDIERIESITDTENVPSQKVLEKNGFKREGELRRRFFKKGQYRSEYIYSLLREEWQKERARGQ
jgi:ribosomal-protein-alanine N-acetyltransferase